MSPVVLFTYNRLDTFILTINALLKATLASETDVFVFSDGVKNEKDIPVVAKIRDYIKDIKGFKSVTYSFSDTNNGLAKSIITGVSKILQTHNSVIVLEDDLIVTTNFLAFMNKALKKYEFTNKVFSVSGFSFKLNNKQVNETYFLNRGWSWGWATWKNRWDNIDWEVKDYTHFKNNKFLQKQFNSGGSDLTNMLYKQMNGELDSWAIRWFYHQFKVGGLTLYPVNSKILNNGFDENATHTTGSISRYKPLLDNGISQNFVFPDKIEINKYYQGLFQIKMGIFSRIISKLETFLIKFTSFFNKKNGSNSYTKKNSEYLFSQN